MNTLFQLQIGLKQNNRFPILSIFRIGIQRNREVENNADVRFLYRRFP